jgi:hypothetical protein
LRPLHGSRTGFAQIVATKSNHARFQTRAADGDSAWLTPRSLRCSAGSMMSAVAAAIVGELGFGGVALVALECRLFSVFGDTACRDPLEGTRPACARKGAPATGGGRLRASSSSAPGEGRDDGSCALERQPNSGGAPEFPAPLACGHLMEAPKGAKYRGSGPDLRAGQAPVSRHRRTLQANWLIL